MKQSGQIIPIRGKRFWLQLSLPFVLLQLQRDFHADEWSDNPGEIVLTNALALVPITA